MSKNKKVFTPELSHSLPGLRIQHFQKHQAYLCLLLGH